MPRVIFRKKRGSRNNNQLTTRLMQISLRMDDHIYYNKPVSRAVAAEFLQEIDALKSKCPGKDVRSLQVIGKISAFMKKIIAESPDQVFNLTLTNQAYTQFPQSCSPVYSLPDDDRPENETNDNESRDGPIIDITEKSNNSHLAQSNERKNAIDNVNFAIANMSIHDEISSQVHIISDDSEDCSQSILDKYSNGNVVCNDGPGHMIDLSIQNPIAPVSNESNSHYSENATQHATVSDGIVAPVEIEKNNKKIIDSGKQNLVTNCTRNKRKFTSEEKIISKNKNKTPKKITRKRKTNSTNDSDGTTNINVKPNEIKKKKNTKTEHITKNLPPWDPDVNGAMKIYTKNVESDLSWIENLRYVREIDPDENDPTFCNLEDSFWDNFSLPSQWNDLDFYA